MQVHKIIETLKSLGSSIMPKDQADLLIRKLTESIKFEFDFGEFPVFTREKMDETIEQLRLPFPLCYFEIPTCGGLLCREIEDSDFILIHVFLYDSNKKAWGTWPPEVMLAIDKKTGTIISLSEDESIQRDLEITSKNERDEAIISGIPSMVIRGLSVMNCSNVVCVENPPPAKLNKKRIKTGKIPLFSYRTLHISNIERNSNSERLNSNSERNCPRLHFRRGHIRRLSSGKTTWVQSCMVGDKSKGVVMKDYLVTK